MAANKKKISKSRRATARKERKATKKTAKKAAKKSRRPPANKPVTPSLPPNPLPAPPPADDPVVEQEDGAAVMEIKPSMKPTKVLAATTLPKATIVPPTTDWAARAARIPMPKSDAPVELAPRDHGGTFVTAFAVAVIGALSAMVATSSFPMPPAEHALAKLQAPVLPMVDEESFTIMIELEPPPAAVIPVAAAVREVDIPPQPAPQPVTSAPQAQKKSADNAEQVDVISADEKAEARQRAADALYSATPRESIRQAEKDIRNGQMPSLAPPHGSSAARIAFARVSGTPLNMEALPEFVRTLHAWMTR